MNNKDIHNNLVDKEIRDFLSQELSKEHFCGKQDVIRIEKQIKQLNEELLRAERGAAVDLLIKKQGWKLFDISYDVFYDEKTYFCFVGTEKEYIQLIKKIETSE